MALTKLAIVQPGERTNPAGRPVPDKLLLAIPDEEFRRIRSRLQFIDLPHHIPYARYSQAFCRVDDTDVDSDGDTHIDC